VLIAVGSIVRMIAGARTTHVVLAIHYHLHATTSFHWNPISQVGYLWYIELSTVILGVALEASRLTERAEILYTFLEGIGYAFNSLDKGPEGWGDDLYCSEAGHDSGAVVMTTGTGRVEG